MGKLKPKQASRPAGDGQLFKALGALVGAAVVALCIFFVFVAGDDATEPPRAASAVPMRPDREATERRAPIKKDLARHDTSEWRALPRSLPECLASQDELMTTPAVWPGFHALCIDALSDDHISLAVHNRSGAPSRSTASGTRSLSARTEPTGGSPSALVDALIASLRAELEAYEFAKVDPLISTSEYDFPPNPWKLFTPMGAPVELDADLAALGVGAPVYLYTGGQFLWPGVRLGHKTRVAIPSPEGDHSTEKARRAARRAATRRVPALRPICMISIAGGCDDDRLTPTDRVRPLRVPHGRRVRLGTVVRVEPHGQVRASSSASMQSHAHRMRVCGNPVVIAGRASLRWTRPRRRMACARRRRPSCSVAARGRSERSRTAHTT